MMVCRARLLVLVLDEVLEPLPASHLVHRGHVQPAQTEADDGENNSAESKRGVDAGSASHMTDVCYPKPRSIM